MSNEEYLETHVFDKLVFWWTESGSESECTFYNRTFYEGLALARTFGFKEPKWYNPWTWSNGFITVG